MDSVLANFYPDEGTVSTASVTVTFPWKARKVIVTNDSATDNLEYKFNNSESYGTLKPTETVSIQFNTRTVILDSPTDAIVSYRVWGYG